MKKLVGFILVGSILCSLTFFNVYAYNPDTYETGLTVEKFVPDEIPYTFRPYRIRAEFRSGSDEQGDEFIKKSWLRVDLLDENADLAEIYKQNSDKERTVTTYTYSGVQTFELDVTLNGTYIFCGWTSNSEVPDHIERVDVTDIEVERPMAELVITETDDRSQGIIATAELKNLECGENAEAEQCVLVKSAELPPGSWPDSLSPEACNAVYDEWLENRVNEWVAEGREIQLENGIYELTEYGEYMLFIEDTNGRYTMISSSAEKSAPLPSPTSAQIPYSIEALAVTNDAGETLTEPPADTGFIVDVTLKEIKERDARDQMFVAVYDTNGKLLSLDYVRCDPAADSEFSIGFYVPPQDAAIGSIKAYVWSSFDSPELLAKTAEINF